MRKYTFVASEPGPLRAALRRELPLLPPSAVRDALKRRDVLVNGARTSGNPALRRGDGVVVYTPAEPQEIPVLYEDNDCLVLIKPAGLNADDNHRSACSLLAWARQRAGAGETPRLVHRLDNATSGLMVLAKNAQSEAALLTAFRKRQVDKRYVCMVLGAPEPAAQVCRAWLIKDAAAARVTVYPQEVPGSREIVTEYRTLQAGAVSRLLVTLHTGRTHQIRAHLAFLGHPVLGDEVYGKREASREHHARGLKLCATQLAFKDDCAQTSLAGRRFEVDAPF